jgi:predicted MFS family arabinose efflux permease
MSFRLLWAGQSVSLLGTQISDLAIRLLAATTLAASSAQLGLLTAAQTAGFLLVGLPAGVVADRVDRRRLLIGADLARAALLVSIPVVGWLGHLTYGLVVAIAFAAGLVQVLFDVTYQSFVPALVGRPRLVAANGRLESSRSSALAGGPALGGLLVQLMGAANAVMLDAASYLVSVACLVRIRVTDIAAPPALQSARRGSIRADIAEGLRFVIRDPILRATTIAATIFNLCYGIMQPVVVFLLVSRLRLSASTVGGLFAAAGVGGLLGGLVAARIARRLGYASAIWITELVFAPAFLLLPLTGHGYRLALFVVGYFVLHFALTVFNVANLSLRQVVCPDRLLGRMNASVRFLMWGALPLGGLLGGLLGSVIGPRATLVVAGIAVLGGAVTLLLSPLRSMRDPTGPIDLPPGPTSPGAPSSTVPATG